MQIQQVCEEHGAYAVAVYQGNRGNRGTTCPWCTETTELKQQIEDLEGDPSACKGEAVMCLGYWWARQRNRWWRWRLKRTSWTDQYGGRL
jgi:hypothetical protein